MMYRHFGDVSIGKGTYVRGALLGRRAVAVLERGEKNIVVVSKIALDVRLIGVSTNWVILDKLPTEMTWGAAFVWRDKICSVTWASRCHRWAATAGRHKGVVGCVDNGPDRLVIVSVRVGYIMSAIGTTRSMMVV